MDVQVVDPLVGRRLDGRYTVRSRIARGGMATVYLAVDERLDRQVALKVMHSGLSSDEDFVRRFIREARSAAGLSHPGIVQVFDQGDDDGVVFLAMEFVPGRTLRDLMRERGPLTPREALDLFEPVLDALSAAHRSGIVHRDVKPENVLLADDGRVKVADFGLARAISTSTVSSRTGVLMGTVAYLAPEQVEHGVADTRSDVYAAGVLLFEMLTASKPFEGETAMQVAYKHVHDDVPAPSSRASGIAAPFDDIVLTAAARDPGERPGDARELLMVVREARRRASEADLDARPVARAPRADPNASTVALGQRQTPNSHTSLLAMPEPPARKRNRGRTALVAALVALVLVGLIGGAAWYVGAGPGAYTAVPPLVGLSQADAEAALHKAGLRSTSTTQYSETFPSGEVISADPSSRVRKGGTVALVVSRGPERHAVPKLAGLSEATAREALANNRLTVGKISRAYDEKVPAGRVLSSNPPSGEQERPGTPVDLVISQGRKPIPITSYVGTAATDAQAALTQAGFVVSAKQAYSDTVPAGNVISQVPSSGTGFRGSTVALVVSKGPKLVPVPNVIGSQIGPATKLLQSKGFTVVVQKAFGGFFGTVRFQTPDAGQQVPQGSTITLTVV